MDGVPALNCDGVEEKTEIQPEHTCL
ncbi:hypothetical protein AFERRI_80054 [Acidithiobacillus ferrivorans]|uniref:Uncharacterized protein n=1 Tax=Acidithiobacillus ferrivorans TaxID=160808 RepID=A0A060UUL6_9PROT|nr:hypothetical protein AFERRI_80054 [Acidithiobacillus ferrivorans]